MTVFVLGTVLGTPLPGACRNLPTGDSLGPANASLRPRGCPEPGRTVPGGRGVKSCRRSPSCSDPALNAAPIIGPLSGPALPLCPGTAAPARAFSPRGRDGEMEVVVALPLCPERCLLASPRSARESNGSVSASVLLPLPGRISGVRQRRGTPAPRPQHRASPAAARGSATCPAARRDSAQPREEGIVFLPGPGVGANRQSSEPNRTSGGCSEPRAGSSSSKGRHQGAGGSALAGSSGAGFSHVRQYRVSGGGCEIRLPRRRGRPDHSNRADTCSRPSCAKGAS